MISQITNMLHSCSVVSESWDPMDCSPPGSFVHEIFQARIPEWGSISSSSGSSQPRDQTLISCISCIAGRFFTTEPSEKSSQCVSWRKIKQGEGWGTKEDLHLPRKWSWKAFSLRSWQWEAERREGEVKGEPHRWGQGSVRRPEGRAYVDLGFTQTEVGFWLGADVTWLDICRGELGCCCCTGRSCKRAT